MSRECRCGRPIPVQSGPGRPRTRCDVCSPPGRRHGAAPLASLPAAVERPTPGTAGLLAETRARLVDAERLDSPEGALSILLAGMLEDGGHTASGVAALSKQLLATLQAAVGDAPAAADGLDELARRRADKAGA